MPHFQLVTTDGDVLGAHELAGQDWQPGMTITLAAGQVLRVVDVLDTDDPEVFAILVVSET